MNSTKTKIAVIGAGNWGKNLVRNFYELGHLAAVGDTKPALFDQFSKEYPNVKYTTDIRALLSDSSIDGVVIATPADTHGELAKEALLNGKDVFVEKPLCLDVDLGQELVKIAREKKKVLMVGHLLHYHPAVIKLKQMIQDGELGKIQYICSNRLNFGMFRSRENVLWSFAPHDISVILSLVGEMPESVDAKGRNFLDHQIADVTLSFFSFKNGMKAHVFVSWLHPFKEQKLIVVGDKKMVVFDDLEKSNKLILYPHTITWQNQVPVAKKAEGQPVPLELSEPLREECRHFIQCMTTRAAPLTDGEEGIRVLKVLNQCQTALLHNSEQTK